jgi:hypothetical protein
MVYMFVKSWMHGPAKSSCGQSNCAKVFSQKPVQVVEQCLGTHVCEVTFEFELNCVHKSCAEVGIDVQCVMRSSLNFEHNPCSSIRDRFRIGRKE